jgi:putative ABC transport system permease protein
MSVQVNPPGQKDNLNVFFIMADADLPMVLGLKVKKGRLFNPQLSTDVMNADSMFGRSTATMDRLLVRPIIATNYTAGLFRMKLNIPPKTINGTPIGVVEDFNSESLHTKIKPTCILAESGMKYGNMLIRVTPGFKRQGLERIQKLYKSFYPDKIFEYNWISDLVNDQYKAEYKLQQLFTCFSLLIIFLACLGLFGLVSFTAEQRVKEIGIRKVLGASVSNIVTLISKDYLGLVLISVVIASPIAWYAMNKWLQDFAYRVHIQWWVFALTAFLAVLIAFFTVSFQSVKAAMANPVKSLRSE